MGTLISEVITGFHNDISDIGVERGLEAKEEEKEDEEEEMEMEEMA